MGTVAFARDIGTIRNQVGARAHDLIRAHLFPIILEGAVSSLKEPKDMLPSAEKVRDQMRIAGVENARVIQHGECYPSVFGEINSDVPNAPTILIGGHYDGQPSEAHKWNITEPHVPKIVVGSSGEHRVFGRGTSDDWGQVLTHLMAVKMIRDLGTALPVNLKFLIEGGEEKGSPDMDKFVVDHKDLLKCDLVILTDSAPGREDFPVITTSARGIVGAIVTVKFGNNSPHSGDSLVPSAVEVLSSILSLRDLRTMRVEIPGFYDDVRILPDAERAKIIVMPFDAELFVRNYGLSQLFPVDGYTNQETMWTQPSYAWHTLLDSHEHKKGLAMVNKLPTEAMAYVTMRLVPNQKPDKIFELFKAEVYRRLAVNTGFGPEAVTIESEGLAHPFSIDTTGPYFDAVAASMSQAFGVKEVDFAGCGGTEPIAMYYQTILGVPVVFNAYNSPSDHYHGDNESFSIETGFEPGIVANILMYQKLWELRNPTAEL